MHWQKGMFLLCILLLFPAPVFATDCARPQDLENLEQRLAEQDEMISELLGRIQVLESNQAAAAAPPAAPAATHVSPMVTAKNKVSISGDFRYRHELISSQGAKQRNRQRIRMRVGMDATVSDDTTLGLQFATGATDPVSNNQTLDTGFDGKQVNIYKAFVSHRLGSAAISAGKMANPFYTPGKSELIWDSDMNPEGVALKYSHNGAFANLGGFWVDERSGSADAAIMGLQAGHSWSNEDAGAHFTLGLAYYDYSHAQNQAAFVDPADSFGNSVNAAGLYANDYNELNISTEYGFRLDSRSARLFADFVTNTAAGGNDNGWLAGMSADTKAQHGVSWRLIYRRMEKDAVIGAFTDSDFAGGGTDSKGLELGMDYNVTKLTKASLSYFMNDQGLAAQRDYDRLQLDYSFKF